MEIVTEQTQGRTDHLLELLRKHGFRLTPQRMAVVRLLAGSEQHPSAEQIYCEIRKYFPTTSLATVYNTIQVLKEIGQLVEVGANFARGHYDASRSDLHPHLICTNCQKITDLDLATENLYGYCNQVIESRGYSNVVSRLEFFGLCPDCSQIQNKTSKSSGVLAKNTNPIQS